MQAYDENNEALGELIQVEQEKVAEEIQKLLKQKNAHHVKVFKSQIPNIPPKNLHQQNK